MRLPDSLFSVVLDVLNQGLVIIDQQHCVVCANKRFTSLFGADLPGVSLEQLNPEFNRAIKPHLKAALRGKKTSYLDFQVVEDQIERQLSIQLSGIREQPGSDWFCMVVVSDLTEDRHRDKELYAGLAEMSRQLSTAQRYQQALFTSKYKDERVSVEAFGQPAIELSGDFFNVSRVDGRHLIVLGDVQSHGIDVAMKAISLQQLCRVLLETDPDASKVLKRLNDFVCDDQQDRFWTSCLFVGTLDGSSGVCHYARAGIPEPVLIKHDGSVKTLSRGDLPLGYFREEKYLNGEVQIDPGDRILIFSDGVTESTRGNNGDILGLDGLITEYRELVSSSSGHLLEKMLERLTEIHGSSDFSDDLTIAEIIFLEHS